MNLKSTHQHMVAMRGENKARLYSPNYVTLVCLRALTEATFSTLRKVEGNHLVS